MVSSLRAEETKTDSTMPEQTAPVPDAAPAADSGTTSAVTSGTASATESGTDSATTPASKPVLYTEPLPLIPETPDQFPKPSGQGGDSQSSVTSAADKLKNSKQAADADALKERIRFREVKTLALKDGKVQAQWEKVEGATTIPEKQVAMKEYYAVLFARIVQIDGSLKNRAAKLQEEALDRLEKAKPADLNPSVHGKNW